MVGLLVLGFERSWGVILRRMSYHEERRARGDGGALPLDIFDAHARQRHGDEGPVA